MMRHSVITVKEWFFDKVNEEAKKYNVWLCGEYTDGMLNHTKMRVDEVLRETEKAYYVALDAETSNGHVKTWNTWIPKSVIE